MKTNTTLLNVGLAVGSDKSIDSNTALRALFALGLAPLGYAVHQSDSEATLVVSVPSYSADLRTLHTLAVVLQQDCVAAFDIERGVGELVGPRAAAWGTFDPEFFLTLSGERLDRASVKVAG